MRARISKALLERPDLRQPAKTVTVWDTGVPGWGLVIQPTGQRSHVLQYVSPLDGRSKRVKLGDHGTALALKQARALAIQKRGEVAAGRCPLTEKRGLQAKSEQARLRRVEHLVAAYLEHQALRLKPESLRHYRVRSKHVLEHLGKRDIESITHADVVRMVDALSKTPTTANQSKSLFSAIWNYAVRNRITTLPNPTHGARNLKTEPDRRVYTVEELAAFGKHLGDVVPQAAAQIRLQALIGARPSEVAALRWADYDRDAQTILARDAKTGTRPLFLGSDAIELLDSLPRTSEWVFPSKTKRGTHAGPPYKEWHRVLKLAGAHRERDKRNKRADNGLHGLRRTFATVSKRVNDGIVTRDLMGHKAASQTETYIGHNEQAVIDGAERAGAKIARALDGKLADVVQIAEASR